MFLQVVSVPVNVTRGYASPTKIYRRLISNDPTGAMTYPSGGAEHVTYGRYRTQLDPGACVMMEFRIEWY